MLPDMHISDWSTTAADNSPKGVTPVGRHLAAQLRLLKSTARELSQNFGWVPMGMDWTIADTDEIRVTGDYTALNFKHRRVWLDMSDGSNLYGWVVDATYTSGETRLTLGFDSGALSPNNVGVVIEEVWIGSLGFIPNSLPLTHHALVVTIDGPASTATITHPFPTSGSGIITADAVYATLMSPSIGSVGWATQSRAYAYMSGSTLTLKTPLTIPGGSSAVYRVLIHHCGSPWWE